MSDPAPHPSTQSQRGLDWLNFFIADVQTGFGPFIAVYLAANGWQQGRIGLILTVGAIVGIGSQMPGGALVDRVRSKRLLVGGSLGLIAVGALALYYSHEFVLVMVAQIAHGATAGVIAPAMAAIGLGLVGHRGLSRRLARNHRYDSFGNAGTAALMGLLGHFLSKQTSFLFASLLCVPAIWALTRIRSGEIDYARARGARADAPDRPGRYRDLLKNRGLIVFGGMLLLFQVANASAIPLVAERLGQQHEAESELVLAGLIIVPQVITALLAGWFGRRADDWGRKPLLLLAFVALAARLLLFTVAPGPLYLLPMQALSGIDAAVIGILTPLVIADVTQGSGRYNLAQGAIGMATGVGAAISTTAVGYIAQWLGFDAGLMVLAGVAALGVGYVWLLLPETRPRPE
ncbi:MFS transporter (plasmid) [Lichenicola cladoniae]|uniref:MFS transporter n=1 Tax=Lichenicola cladoniae TaxID=1484109 RepID=A0A6M8HXE6_9PROT|nr:MFS transporter [Lichenicola cladoniae]NPD69808.1 MFS transporter [Acetobacteraceae bacterium]QKE93224.1 MFS transporter [Lichenicola cladoniae]